MRRRPLVLIVAVCACTVSPSLGVHPEADELSLAIGGSTTFLVRVARTDLPEPVVLSVAGLPEGVAVEPLATCDNDAIIVGFHNR